MCHENIDGGIIGPARASSHHVHNSFWRSMRCSLGSAFLFVVYAVVLVNVPSSSGVPQSVAEYVAIAERVSRITVPNHHSSLAL